VACISTGWSSFGILVFYAINLLETLRASTVILIAMTAFLTGAILLATASVPQTYWSQTFVGILFLRWGRDMSFPAASIIMTRPMPLQHEGVAASLVNTFANYSILIGRGWLKDR
jgi:hypothetical protein